MKLKYFFIILVFLALITILGLMIYSSLTGDFGPATMLENNGRAIVNFFKSIMNTFNQGFNNAISKLRY